MSLNCVYPVWFLVVIGYASTQSRFNPTIIQDSRVEPKVDGTFGFQYRTEDGISHSAQGDPSGFIQGSYSYKDPTGLKVNFNYFAGARTNANSSPQTQNRPFQYNNPEPQAIQPEPQAVQPEPMQYFRDPEPYQSPQKYVPRTRPPASYTRQQYQPAQTNKYTQATFNEVYDNTDYSQYRI